jgi:tetratricopeptide (TPR) repeat protein
LQLLDQVDATESNQAVSLNLRGKIFLAQGKESAAETALQKAVAVDPQFLEARFNLTQIPFRKREYDSARKELEALLGAIAGGKQQRHWEQLIRYQIFLTVLLEGRDGPAQKALDDFKMMDETPALYYGQAAWLFSMATRSWEITGSRMRGICFQRI